MLTGKTVNASQAGRAYGQCLSSGREFRFIAKSEGYATPWRSVPKDGIVAAMHKLTNEERQKLGEHFSLQLRGPVA